MKKTIAIIPVKNLENAKQRLSTVLNKSLCADLCLAMLEDILRCLKQVPELSSTLIIGNDPRVAALARRYHVEVIEEKNESDLNSAVTQARSIVKNRGIEQMLYLPSDIPLITPRAVQQLLNANGSLILAPCEENTGTNALRCEPKQIIPFCFGENSFALHQQQAKIQGNKATVVHSKVIAFDVDTPKALTKLKSQLAHAPTLAPCTAKVTAQIFAPIKNIPLSNKEIHSLIENSDLNTLMLRAATLTDKGHGQSISFSKKVFIPLTQLCRDVCHYCTFAQTPSHLDQPFLEIDQVLEIAQKGAKAGCKEALFTLGDQPEARYSVAKTWLSERGYASTLDYLEHAANAVFNATGLLPHLNPGLMTQQDLSRLKKVSASMGIMLESSAMRLCEKNMPHYGSPDKDPEKRLKTIRLAGELKIPFTTGILIGIGETRSERIDSLLKIRALHQKFGHIQEIIIQNFRAKPNTKMAQHAEPNLNELLWTISIARIIFGSNMNIQAPPNLSPNALVRLIDAGINDWGGISPLTPDHVNPEAPWPHLTQLKAETKKAGKQLVERLSIYPRYILNDLVSPSSIPIRWMEKSIAQKAFALIEGDGFVRSDEWNAGKTIHPPQSTLKHIRAVPTQHPSKRLESILIKAKRGQVLTQVEIVTLLEAKDNDLTHVCLTADSLRKQACGETVTYAINRNINYTNICTYKCQFCAFSKGKGSENLRGAPYTLNTVEIVTKVLEAQLKGATEVCLQGGIHPLYTGQTYIDICTAIKNAAPNMHIHAFSPLEIWQGARTLGMPLDAYLKKLKEAGLDTLPGTAAEILDDEVRNTLCPDKITSAQWLQVMENAHRQGFKTTATIMFGHIENYQHIANHLAAIRSLQDRTQGFTEFVPLPFVHSYAPIYQKGHSRTGPSFREAILLHAVARLAFHTSIHNIQASWTKLGHQGAKTALMSGANDLGGTLMNESITRAAGASHGQEIDQRALVSLIKEAHKRPQQRTTRYGHVNTLPNTQDERIPITLI